MRLNTQEIDMRTQYYNDNIICTTEANIPRIVTYIRRLQHIIQKTYTTYRKRHLFEKKNRAGIIRESIIYI